jgi:hypothetical protein
MTAADRWPSSNQNFDALSDFKNTLRAGPPWSSVVDFALHRSFCGKKLYPRQLTLLKLIYLETEQMTDYDLDVINSWAQGFKRHIDIVGTPPDVWDRVKYLQDNGYRHFTHVQFVGGRRGSKGIEGGVLGAERLAYFYSLDDWQAHFGLDPGSVGELTVVSTSQATASRRQFSDIRRTVMGCQYLRTHIVGNRYTEFSLRTPADEERINALQIAGVPVDHEIASLQVTAASTVSSSVRGGASFCIMFDEMAHMIMGTDSTKSGEEIYEALLPSLDQFGKEQLVYVPSSPYTKIGQFYELYKQGCVTLDVYNAREGRIEQQTFTEKMLGTDAEAALDASVAEPEWLVIQLPSWELYADWEHSHTLPVRRNRPQMGPRFKNPVQWPPDGARPENTRMKRLERRNPDKFKVERRAQFAAVIDAYLDEAMVDAMFTPPRWREPLVEQDAGRLMYAYRMHGDPARTNANFGFAIAHLEDAPCDGCGWQLDPTEFPPPPPHHCEKGGHVWPHVIVDKLKVWKPQDYPEHTIDYVAVGEQIDAYCARFQSTTQISFDQWNSAGLLSALKRKYSGRMRVVQHDFTEKQNQRRCELFKSLLNLGWIHAYRDSFFEEGQSLLEVELKFLQEKNGKVVKQEFGPCTTKDLADAVMVIATELTHNALDRWYTTNTLAVGSTAAAALPSGRELDRQQAHGITTADATNRATRNRDRLHANRGDRARGLRRPDTLLRSRGRWG